MQSWLQEGARTSHCVSNSRTWWLMGWTEKNLNWKRAIHLPERAGEDLRWFTRTSAPEGWIDSTHERQHDHLQFLSREAFHKSASPEVCSNSEQVNHDKVTYQKKKPPYFLRSFRAPCFSSPSKRGGRYAAPKQGPLVEILTNVGHEKRPRFSAWFRPNPPPR